MGCSGAGFWVPPPCFSMQLAQTGRFCCFSLQEALGREAGEASGVGQLGWEIVRGGGALRNSISVASSQNCVMIYLCVNLSIYLIIY